MTLTIDLESPLGPDLDLLFQRHTAEMHADTPPGSIHMMPKEALENPAIAFFVVRDAGQPVAMGAIKDLGASEGELKSMHVLSEQRGRGVSPMAAWRWRAWPLPWCSANPPAARRLRA